MSIAPSTADAWPVIYDEAPAVRNAHDPGGFSRMPEPTARDLGHQPGQRPGPDVRGEQCLSGGS